MAIVQNQFIEALLKDVYLKGVFNNKNQASPIINEIKKENWSGGKAIKYSATYGNGGNFGSNYEVISNNPTSGVRNLEWEMTPGYLFGLFDIDMPEILSTAEERGAYMQALENKMGACFDGIGKHLATYLYGGKAGVIDKAQSEITVAASGNELTLTASGALKLDVGSRFVIATEGAANSAVPTSDLLGGNSTPVVFTVTNIDDEKIVFSASVAGGKIYVGDYIELYTARTGNTFSGIEGLADILPSLGDRTGNLWESYIKTDFRGVDRSEAVSRLAGQFVKAEATGDTRLTDALVKLLEKTKRAGGINDTIIVNDETFSEIGKELGIQRNLWQASNSDSPSKQSATAGFNKLGVAFEDAFIGRTRVDPYCPYQTAYMFDMDDLRLYDMGNVSKALNPVGNGSLGKYDPESVGNGGLSTAPLTTGINFDKLFTIHDGQKGMYGRALEVTANVYANFLLRKTASSGVASLA